MRDFNETTEEKWRKRRKKGYNWPKLIVMIVLLGAIIYAMSALKKAGNIVSAPMAEVQTEVPETQIDNPEMEADQNQEQSQESPSQ
ncbi:MAG: hypothetical protein LHW60_05575 [Candidatus Cloacimonetes bacterium]|nr:hypothetical protein [Candidatus Cloacimonadota bacterium]NLO44600.1 hypothetical protein [Candidatus Cloacimonadota bacterium]